MDTRNFAFEGFASSSDTEMKDNPADRGNMTNPSLTTPSADAQNPGQSLSLDTFEKNSRDIIRNARELGVSERQLNFIRVQQEQLRALFLEATKAVAEGNKAVAASAANIQGYQNHQDFARHYSIELKLAVEQCDFIADDHHRYNAELEEMKKKLNQVNKEMNDAKRAQDFLKKEHEAMKRKQEASERETEALKRDMKELQQLFRVHVL
ncbi:hypothetical protein K4K54_005618 [Colletotrichum sp. SAR 10_86]|nr:hypothetical protein K4K54_005618 [Colletotrichum sp. SAR 10_86]